MTVCTVTVFGINVWFADLIVSTFDLNEIYYCVSFFSCVVTFSNFFVESFNSFVLFAVDVESQAVLFNFSFYAIKNDFLAFCLIVRTDVFENFCFFGQFVDATLWIGWQFEAFSFNFSDFSFGQFVTAVSIRSTPPLFCLCIVVERNVAFRKTEFAVIQSNIADSIYIVFAFRPVSVIGQLIVSVQRHPDNVTWFEVNVFVVVQLGGSFLNDVAVFVGYKQFTIKFEVVRPISLVIGSAVVGNSKSVSAHAKYHSRSQCYGKYFFHSLSSS